MEEQRSNFLSADAKSIVRSVYSFCKEEKQGGIKISLKRSLDRAEAMTGIKRRTILGVMQHNQGGGDRQPLERVNRLELDDFDRSQVRRTIHRMYTRDRILPTLRNIREELRESIGYVGSSSHLRKVLVQLGFTYRRCQLNRKVLMERPDVVNRRITYLREIKALRDAGHPIVYADETYVHSTHSVNKCWQSADISLQIPFSKGERMIILHAGSEDGFIPGAELVFKARSSSGDYHDEMNTDNFMRWLSEKLIPNLKPASVLVIDNAAYHNVQEDRCPTMSTRKADMQAWLTRHGIAFQPDMLKAELLALCKHHQIAPVFVVDSLLQAHGHRALRLPPYHADLNPIEMIWANLKGGIARRNLKFSLPDVKRLIGEGLNAITADDWRGCCRHVTQAEAAYWASDIVMEEEVERVVIHLGSDSDVSSDSETDTASECGETTDTADECC